MKSVPSGLHEGRRERRKAETRRRLLAAARALFVERGFSATRPQDIARRADVGAGTFYLYFADRREVFLAFTEQATAELMECVRRSTEGARDFETGLRRSLEALCAYSDAHPGVVRAAFADEAVIAADRSPEPRTPARTGSRLRDRLADGLAQRLQSGMRSGKLCDEFDPHLVAYGIVGFVHQAFVHGAADRRQLIDTVTRFCGRALVPGPHQEIAK
ncbi:MAG: TetR/AcrR family transcriptional regulator [Myxococcota bacterium]